MQRLISNLARANDSLTSRLASPLLAASTLTRLLLAVCWPASGPVTDIGRDSGALPARRSRRALTNYSRETERHKAL